MSTPTPPIAAVRPHDITTNGHTRTDPYFWLREKSNPEVLDYLKAENAYTEAAMAHTKTLQAALYKEMVDRIQETDSSAPVRRDDYYYYSRTVAGLQYQIFCRKQGSGDAAEEVILDVNALAEGHDYFRIGVFEVSPDHKLLAYSTDSDGYEQYTVYIKNLADGSLLPDQIPNTAYNLVWGSDNETLYYTTRDDAQRAYRLHRHRLGSDPAGDELVYQEDDALFRVTVGKTRDARYIILKARSIETSEVHFLDAADPGGAFTIVEPRRAGVEYDVAHRDGLFYFWTNDEAVNFRVMTAAADAPGRANWQERVAHRPAVKLDGIDLFAGHLVLYGRENGLQIMEVARLSDDHWHRVDFPEPVYSFHLRDLSNLDFDSDELRFVYTSLTTPMSDYDYNLNSGTWTLIKREPVLGGFDPADYVSERLFATAGDGTQVPISLVYRRDLDRSQPNPLLLYGYGSYGFSIDPSFVANRLCMLDRGVIWALAHIRGGEEMGRHWYLDGKFLKKKNTFEDFIACAQTLVDQGYTAPDKMACWGGSAGGLLIGATLNMAPDLFHAAIASVPFVDVVTTMLDESIPLTIGEFEEWGNPKDPVYYEYMLSYSPYDNVADQRYPNLLVEAGLNDPRVHYWEPAKWTAKLRTLPNNPNKVLLKTNMGAGHSGASGRYDYLEEKAFEFAFLLDNFGLA